jgi:ferredoxin
MKITEDCISCGTCVDACPLGAIAESGDTYAIDDSCTECRACVDSCPVNAIVD